MGMSPLLRSAWNGWEALAESCEGKRKHFGLGRIPLVLPHAAVSDKPQPPTPASVSSRDGAVCGGWGTAPAAQTALTSLGSSSADALRARRRSCLRASVGSWPGRQQPWVCCPHRSVTFAGGLVPGSLPTGVRRGRR